MACCAAVLIATMRVLPIRLSVCLSVFFAWAHNPKN